jgi:ribokinase
MADVVVVGSINVDLTIEVDRVPSRGETLPGSDLRRGGGGKGANQAVACARLGRAVSMVGAVGHDADGTWMLELLAAENVDTRAVLRSSRSTGQALILVEPDGESTIVISPGANASLSPANVDAAATLVVSARCVLAQQEVSAATVARAAELASGLFVLNPAPARPVSAEVLARVDVLVPNRHELAGLVGTEPSADLDVIGDMARSLDGPTTVVVTLGPDGALVVERSRRTHVAAVEAKAVDATAAGDTFCAALVDALLDGADVIAATRWATRAAAVAVTRRGAMDSIPRRSEVKR